MKKIVSYFHSHLLSQLLSIGTVVDLSAAPSPEFTVEEVAIESSRDLGRADAYFAFMLLALGAKKFTWRTPRS